MSTANNTNNNNNNHPNTNQFPVILSSSSSAPTNPSLHQSSMNINYPPLQTLFSSTYPNPSPSSFGSQLPSLQNFASGAMQVRGQMASEAAAPLFDNSSNQEPESVIENKKRKRFTKEEDDKILSVCFLDFILIFSYVTNCKGGEEI